MVMFIGSMNWLLISTVKAGRVDGVLMDVDAKWYTLQDCLWPAPMGPHDDNNSVCSIWITASDETHVYADNQWHILPPTTEQ